MNPGAGKKDAMTRNGPMEERTACKNGDDQSLVFNEYSEEYNRLMEENLRILTPAGNIGYFACHKMAIFRRLVPQDPEKILEYGCGIGNNLAFITGQFPGVPVYGCDTSQKSLDVAGQRFPGIRFFLIPHERSPEFLFDCILVSDVIHHIPNGDREYYLDTILDLLRPGGKIVFFEHNPYNPLTRALVSSCPFDDKAELVSRRILSDLLTRKGLTIVESRYCFYFPEFLKWFDRFESLFSWLPLGGKYYVLAVRNP